MTSAHRSSDSAHRSESAELHTEVFIVKTPDDRDAVIVSFVDDGENNGIFLYEPGADPVELMTVRQEDHANEYELAHISGEVLTGRRLANGDLDTEEVTWPGDGMTTFAERDAAVAQATEDHGNLQQAHDALHQAAQGLVLATREVHRESHGAGPQSLCADPVCRAAEAVTVEL